MFVNRMASPACYPAILTIFIAKQALALSHICYKNKFPQGGGRKKFQIMIMCCCSLFDLVQSSIEENWLHQLFNSLLFLSFISFILIAFKGLMKWDIMIKEKSACFGKLVLALLKKRTNYPHF